MGRTAARFALRDRLAGTCRSKRRAAACTTPLSRPGGRDTNAGRELAGPAPTANRRLPLVGPLSRIWATFLSGNTSRRNPMKTDRRAVRLPLHSLLAVLAVGLVLTLSAGAGWGAPGGG